MALHVIRHPLCEHALSYLRDRNTTTEQFRRWSKRLAWILVSEATRDLPTRSVQVDTPLERTVANRIDIPVVVVSILRAGIGMVDAVVNLIPEVSVGFIGMERDERTAEASSYYLKLPSLEGACVLVVDPMLATGGSSLQTIRRVYEEGAKEVRFINIIAAPEGIRLLEETFPRLRIYTATVDRELNEQKYILPGLGDAGDRFYGTT